MCKTSQVDDQLETWGDWVRRDSGLGYGRSVLAPRRAAAGDPGGDDDTMLRLDAAVAALPNALAQVMKQRYLARSPNRVAAGKLGICERTYRRRVQSAHEHLAELLAGDPGTGMRTAEANRVVFR